MTHSLRSDIIGRLFVRDSTPRLNCDRAIIGTLSSRASALSDRVTLENFLHPVIATGALHQLQVIDQH